MNYKLSEKDQGAESEETDCRAGSSGISRNGVEIIKLGESYTDSLARIISEEAVGSKELLELIDLYCPYAHDEMIVSTIEMGFSERFELELYHRIRHAHVFMPHPKEVRLAAESTMKDVRARIKSIFIFARFLAEMHYRELKFGAHAQSIMKSADQLDKKFDRYFQQFYGSLEREHVFQSINAKVANMYLLCTPEKQQSFRLIHCFCGEACQRIHVPFCKFCLMEPPDTPFCLGCGDRVAAGMTHCCACHCNQNMCPICEEFHESDMCRAEDEFVHQLPSIIIGDRRQLGKMGVERYIVVANSVAGKLMDERPELTVAIATYMRRIICLLGAKNRIVDHNNGFATMTTWMTEKVAQLGGVCGGALLNVFVEASKIVLGKIITEVTPIYVCAALIIKTLTRIHIFENCPLQVAMEVLWDPSFITVCKTLRDILFKVIKSCTASFTPHTYVDHSVQTAGLIGTALFYLSTTIMGFEPDKIVSFTRIVPMFEKLIPNNIDRFLEKIPLIKHFVSTDINEHMATKCPRTAAFRAMKVQAKAENWLELYHKRLLRDAYINYRREAMDFDSIDQVYWLKFKDDLSFSDDDMKKLPASRIQPVGRYLHGAAGGGKTISSDIILRVALLELQAKGYISMRVNQDEAVFDIQPGMKHWDGFLYQKLLRLNDLLTKKALPGEIESECLLLMKIIDTAPFMAPGAAIKHKNLCVSPFIVLATGNLTWQGVMKNSGLNNGSALKRRVPKSYLVQPRHANPDGSMDHDADWTDIDPWDRCTYTSDQDGKVYTLVELIKDILDEMFMRLETPPVVSCADKLWNIMSKEKAAESHGNICVKENVEPEDAKEVLKAVFPEEGEKGNEEIHWEEEVPKALPVSDEHVDMMFSSFFKGKDYQSQPSILGSAMSSASDLLMSTIGEEEVWDDEDTDVPQTVYNDWVADIKVIMVERAKKSDYSSYDCYWILATIDPDWSNTKQFRELSNRGMFPLIKDGSTDDLSAEAKLDYDDFVSDCRKGNSELHPRYCLLLEEGIEIGKRGTGKTVTPIEDRIFSDRIASIYETIHSTVIKVRGSAAELANGFTMSAKAAKEKFREVGASLMIPSSVHFVSQEFVETQTQRLKSVCKSEYTAMLLGALILFGVCTRYAIKTAPPKPKRLQNHQMPPRTAFQMGSVNAPKGYIEKIQSSMVEFSLDGETSVGECFAVSSCELIVPLHMVAAINNETIYLRHPNDGLWQTFFMAEEQKHGGFVFSGDEERDLALVQFTQTHVKFCGGNNFTKLVREPVLTGGFSSRVNTTIPGNNLYAYEEPITLEHAEGRVKWVYPIDADSWHGICGAVYVDSENVGDARVHAMHVSGHVNGKKGFASPIDQKWVEERREELKDWFTCPDPQELTFDWKRGHCYDGKTDKIIHLPTKAARTDLKPIQDSFCKGGFPCEYAQAVLLGVGTDGKTPYQRGIDKTLSKMQKRRNSPSWNFTDEEWSHVIDFPHDDTLDVLEDWEEVIARVNGHAPVDKKKSAGLGLGMKGDYWDSEDELDSVFVDMLEAKILRMQKGDFEAGWAGTTLKGEARLKHKVAAGSTRIFANVGIDGFMICKRYCEPIYKWLRKYGNECGIHYECSPDMSAQMRAAYYDELTIGHDVQDQENSHCYATWETVFRFCLNMRIFVNDPNHPQARNTKLFGPLEPINLIRWGCFLQEANTIYVMEGRLAKGNGKNPSGGFLTAALNCIAQFIIAKSLELALDTKWQGFGDDSLNTLSKECALMIAKLYNVDITKKGWGKEVDITIVAIIVNHWKRFGYTLTSQVKDAPIMVERHQDVTLCGRSLSRIGQVYMCPLEVPRIVKAVCFFNYARPNDYAQTVLNFLQELSYLPVKLGTKLLACMKWSNKSQLSSFLPHYDMVMSKVHNRDTTLIQQQIRQWLLSSHKGYKKTSRKIEERNFRDFYVDMMDSDGAGPSTPEETLVRGVPSADFSMAGTKMNPLERTTTPMGVTYPVLEREVVIARLNIPPTAVSFDPVFNFTFPSAIIDANPRMQEAIENTAYLHYDGVEITVEMNVSSYNNGAIIIAASPMADVPTSLEAMTSGPYEMINFQKSTEEATDTKRKIISKVRIPFNREIFCALSESYNTPSLAFDFVRVQAVVLENGNAATQGPIPVIVKARLLQPQVVESATLWTPTPLAKKYSFFDHMNETDRAVVGPTETTMVPGPAGKEQTSIKNFPVVHTGLKVAELAVGACKVVAPPQIVYSRPSWGMSAPNMFGSDGCTVLAAADTGRGIAPPNESSIDPMSFETMSRIPTLIGDVIPWAATTDPGTELWFGECCPWPTIGEAYNSNFSRIASCFMYWKGDMVFHFEAFPNAFMTGTYMVTVDYRPANMVPANFDDTNNLYRVFVDLEEGASVTVRIPYVSSAPWRVASDNDVPVITLMTVTTLGLNTGGADSCPFRVFMHAENVSFMWPFYNQNIVLPPPSPMAQLPQKGKDKGKAVEDHMDESEISMTVPYAKVVLLGPSPSRFNNISVTDYQLRLGAGEAVTNMRQLLKRFYLLNTFAVSDDSVIKLHDPGQPLAFPDWFQNLAKMYTFTYGGYRYKQMLASRFTLRLAASWSDDTLVSVNQMEPWAFFNPSDIPIAEAQVNAVCKYPFRKISVNSNAMPGLYGKQLRLGPSELWFSVSESFEWFGKNYLNVTSSRPSSTNFKTQATAALP